MRSTAIQLTAVFFFVIFVLFAVPVNSQPSSDNPAETPTALLNFLEDVPAGITIKERPARPEDEHVARIVDLSEQAIEAAAQGLRYVPDQYLIVFEENVFKYRLIYEDRQKSQRVAADGETLDYKAERLVSEVGGRLHTTWNFAVAGFSAELTPIQAETLARRAEIKRVSRLDLCRS